MDELINRLEELAVENAKLKVAVEELDKQLKESEKYREILAKTSKVHCDFIDDLGLRQTFQEYYDKLVEEEQKNG